MNKYSFELNGETIEYTIKDKVTFEEVTDAYNKMIQCLFPDIPDDVRGEIEIEYTPHMGDLGRDYAIMSLYTDINFSEIDNEDIWTISNETDVLQRIFESGKRECVIRRIDRWIEKFAEDYKTRILSRRKIDQLVDALTMISSPNGALIDTDGANELLSKIKGMSGEEIVNAITSGNQK